MQGSPRNYVSPVNTIMEYPTRYKQLFGPGRAGSGYVKNRTGKAESSLEIRKLSRAGSGRVSRFDEHPTGWVEPGPLRYGRTGAIEIRALIWQGRVRSGLESK